MCPALSGPCQAVMFSDNVFLSEYLWGSEWAITRAQALAGKLVFSTRFDPGPPISL